MKRFLNCLLAVCLWNTAWAGNHLSDIKALEEIEGPYVETSQQKITLNGFVDAGYSYNFLSKDSTMTTRGMTADGSNRGDFHLYQTKLTLEKTPTEENEFQTGFRIDMFYGEDAADFGQDGAGSDSLYLQQALVLMRLPYGNGIDLSIGKYAAVIGYEAEERPDNINITMGNASAIDPAWYMGILSEYAFNDTIEAGLGIGNGNGIDNGIGIDTASDEIALTGFINFNVNDNANIQTGFHYAPGGDTGYGQTENKTAIIWNTLGNWMPQCMDERLLLAFNTSLATFNEFSADDSTTFFGTALYAKYYFTNIISLGGRAEYVHTDDDQFLGLGGAAPTNNDLWGLTATLGFDLSDNLLLKCEYRVDWGKDMIQTTVIPGTEDGPAHTLAVEIVYAF